MNSFIDGCEPGKDGILTLAHRALALQAGAAPRRREGLRLAALFFNPSLRTRTSVEIACHMLGIHPVILQPGTSSWGWAFDDRTMDGDHAEHAREAIPVLSGFADILAVRSFAGLTDLEADRQDPVIRAFQRLSNRPLINLESAQYHPLQGLADTATWCDKLGDLAGRRLVLSWAPHPKTLPAAVPQQVLLSAALQGMDITVAHPPGFDLDPLVLSRAVGLAEAAGGGVKIQTHRDWGDADVIVAKNWSGFSGYADRAEESARRATHGDWMLTQEDLGSAGFMHCLPVRRGVVVAPEVLDGPSSWVQQTANLRLWTAMAVLEQLG